MFFLMIAILTDVRWNIAVILICISLIIGAVEHLFMCLLAICIFSLENCSVLLPILNQLFLFCVCLFLMLSHMSCSYVLDISPYLSYNLQISSPSQWVFFSFCWWFPSLCKSFLSLTMSHLFIFIFVVVVLLFRATTTTCRSS